MRRNFSFEEIFELVLFTSDGLRGDVVEKIVFVNCSIEFLISLKNQVVSNLKLSFQ